MGRRPDSVRRICERIEKKTVKTVKVHTTPLILGLEEYFVLTDKNIETDEFSAVPISNDARSNSLPGTYNSLYLQAGKSEWFRFVALSSDYFTVHTTGNTDDCGFLFQEVHGSSF